MRNSYRMGTQHAPRGIRHTTEKGSQSTPWGDSGSKQHMRNSYGMSTQNVPQGIRHTTEKGSQSNPWGDSGRHVEPIHDSDALFARNRVPRGAQRESREGR